MKINEKVFFAKISINTLISGTKVKRNKTVQFLIFLNFQLMKINEKVFFAKISINTLISGTNLK